MLKFSVNKYLIGIVFLIEENIYYLICNFIYNFIYIISYACTLSGQDKIIFTYSFPYSYQNYYTIQI